MHQPFNFCPTRRFTKRDNLSSPKHASRNRLSLLLNKFQTRNIFAVPTHWPQEMEKTGPLGAERAGLEEEGAELLPPRLGLQHLPHTPLTAPGGRGLSIFYRQQRLGGASSPAWVRGCRGAEPGFPGTWPHSWRSAGARLPAKPTCTNLCNRPTTENTNHTRCRGSVSSHTPHSCAGPFRVGVVPSPRSPDALRFICFLTTARRPRTDTNGLSPSSCLRGEGGVPPDGSVETCFGEELHSARGGG